MRSTRNLRFGTSHPYPSIRPPFRGSTRLSGKRSPCHDFEPLGLRHSGTAKSDCFLAVPSSKRLFPRSLRAGRVDPGRIRRSMSEKWSRYTREGDRLHQKKGARQGEAERRSSLVGAARWQGTIRRGRSRLIIIITQVDVRWSRKIAFAIALNAERPCDNYMP